MKQLFIGALVLATGVLAGCDPNVLAVRDARELQSVSLGVDQDDATWVAGESRVFTVGFEPADALVRDIQLTPNVAGLVEIVPGERPGLFRVMARKAGRVKLTVTVTDRYGIVRSDGLAFTISGTFRPMMAVRLRQAGEAGHGKDFPKVLVCDSGQVFETAAFSDHAGEQFLLSVTDPEVLAVEQTGPCAWKLQAREPGCSRVKVMMTDAFGDKREKCYEVYVYGSVTLGTCVDLDLRMLGLYVRSFGYEPTGARLSVDGSAFAWPTGHQNHRTSVPLNSLKDYIVLEDGFGYPDMLDVAYPFEELETLLPFQGVPFEVRGLQLQFGFELDNPYIRVAGVWADMPEGRNFVLRVGYEQTGLEEQVEVPDDEAETVDPDSPATGGWSVVPGKV